MVNGLETKALVITPKKHVELKNIYIESKNSQEVLLKWAISAVCNSERRRFKLTKSHENSEPFIGGHEAVGVMEEDQYIKKKYVLLPHSNCLTRASLSKCPACTNGTENLCTKMQHAGLDPDTPSGFTEKMLVPRNQLFDVSEIDYNIAIFLEPLACVIRSWDRTETGLSKGNKSIVIVGGGPIGCLHAFYLNRINNNNKIFIKEADPKRQKILINIFSGYNNIEIIEADYDIKTDISVMTASSSSSFYSCVQSTKKEGMVLLFSGLDEVRLTGNDFFPEIIHRNEFIHYTSDHVFVGSSGYTQKDLINSKRILIGFEELNRIFTGKVYGLNSSTIHNTDGSTTKLNEPALVKDIKGQLPQHIKIKYFNNFDFLEKSVEVVA